MSVKLRKRSNKDGTTSLLIDTYSNGVRKQEFLKELKLIKATNANERAENKNKLLLANEIIAKRQIELASNEYELSPSFKKQVDFVIFFQSYIDNYQKQDKRNMQGALNRFKKFMVEESISSITMKQLTENVVIRFKDYLQNSCEGEGAASYFARFKKFLKYVTREGIISKNPSQDITIKRDNHLVKAVLTPEEIQQLAQTHNSNEMIKRAFLFCCFTGLSFVDIKDLKWKNIDLAANILRINRKKSNQPTTIAIHNSALNLLPIKSKNVDLVYTLPSNTACLKSLDIWVKKAGISKHITWHCARHSFATNVYDVSKDPLATSQALGHSSLKYMPRYTRIADQRRANAINLLPEIEIK